MLQHSMTKDNDIDPRQVGASYGHPRHGGAPPCNDPRWEVWSEPVFGYLMNPKTWRQLKDCATRHDTRHEMLRQIIAWLEIRHMVRFDDRTKSWKRIN